MPKIINCELSSDIDELYLYVISDVHIGSKQFDEKQFKKLISEIENTQNSIVILNGDIMDTGIIGSKTDPFSQEMSPSEQLRTAAELLKPIKHKIKVVTSGNHEQRVSKLVNYDISELLCVELFGRKKTDEIYSPSAYLFFVEFGRNQGRNCRKTIYSIYGMHGTGGGSTVSSKIGRLEKMGRLINADVLIHSHTHVLACFKDTFTTVDYKNKKATTKTSLFINSNAFLLPGGYGEALGLKPCTTEYPKIILNGHHREVTAVL